MVQDVINQDFMDMEGERHPKITWWKTLLDVKEAKTQIWFSMPMICINMSYYLIFLVSVMFAGHLGKNELAASTLANSWATITGFSLMVGLSGSLETLCGQGFGAEQYPMLGVYLQSSCIISLFFSVLLAVFWWFTEPVLILIQQSPTIAKSASVYMKYLIPAIFAFGILQNILRFLQTQSIIIPLLVCSIFPLLLHIGITYVLVKLTSLGYVGAPLAVSITMWICVLMLTSYVNQANKFKQTWTGLSSMAFFHVFANLKIALPSAAMVCLEYWAFEILVLLAGIMPDSEISTSLLALCVSTEAITFNIFSGIAAAASTRVSNEVGGCNPQNAKRAMRVAVKLSFLLALVVILSLGLGHNLWVGLFSDNSIIVSKFSSMIPFLLFSIPLDSIQGVLSGVSRGCGWQRLVVLINLASYYLIGMPISVLLAFKFKLHSKGLWIGLICGMFCQTITLVLVMILKRWTKIENM